MATWRGWLCTGMVGGLVGCPGTIPENDDDTSTGPPTTNPTTTPVLDSGSVSGDSSSSGLADSTGVTTDTSTGGDTTDTGSSSSSGEPPPTSTVEGQVEDFVMGSPIPGAEISLYDDPAVFTTADGMGMFSLMPVPSDAVAHFVVAPSLDYWGSVTSVGIGPEPVQSGVVLAPLTHSIIDTQLDLLAPQGPAMLDPTEAIIIVRLLQNTAVSEGPTTIDIDPAPASGTYYAPDSSGAPILDQSIIEYQIFPAMIVFNVPDTSPADIMIMATHPARTCSTVHPEFPTIGEHITLVDVSCPAP